MELLNTKKITDLYNEDLELYNLVNEDIEVFVLIDENGELSFIEEEIVDLLETYEIEEEDLYDFIYSENSNLSEGILGKIFSKKDNSEKILASQKQIMQELRVIKDKNADEIYKLNSKVNELERKHNRNFKIAAGIGISLTLFYATKKIIEAIKKKRKAAEDEESMIEHEAKTKKEKEKVNEDASSIASDDDEKEESYNYGKRIITADKFLNNKLVHAGARKFPAVAAAAAVAGGAYIVKKHVDEHGDEDITKYGDDEEEVNESFVPFMELVKLDENTIIDVYFTESGLFIDEEEMQLIMEHYDELTEDDIYEIILEASSITGLLNMEKENMEAFKRIIERERRKNGIESTSRTLKNFIGQDAEDMKIIKRLIEEERKKNGLDKKRTLKNFIGQDAEDVEIFKKLIEREKRNKKH